MYRPWSTYSARRAERTVPYTAPGSSSPITNTQPAASSSPSDCLSHLPLIPLIASLSQHNAAQASWAPPPLSSHKAPHPPSQTTPLKAAPRLDSPRPTGQLAARRHQCTLCPTRRTTDPTPSPSCILPRWLWPDLFVCAPRTRRSRTRPPHHQDSRAGGRGARSHRGGDCSSRPGDCKRRARTRGQAKGRGRGRGLLHCECCPPSRQQHFSLSRVHLPKAVSSGVAVSVSAGLDNRGATAWLPSDVDHSGLVAVNAPRIRRGNIQWPR